jgi:hypothetical protein
MLARVMSSRYRLHINKFTRVARTKRILSSLLFYIWPDVVADCGPGSSVGIATAYGQDGPGIESRWGRDFLHLSRPVLRPTRPPVQWVPGLSRG